MNCSVTVNLSFSFLTKALSISKSFSMRPRVSCFWKSSHVKDDDQSSLSCRNVRTMMRPIVAFSMLCQHDAPKEAVSSTLIWLGFGLSLIISIPLSKSV